MAAVTNPQTVAFCNQAIRPLFDKMMQLYYYIIAVEAAWTAQGLAALIPNSTDLIVDGSAVDGRPPITDGQVNILIANAQTVANLFTANSNLILNQTLVGSVNPQAGVSGL
jgi:hypothetical protein